MGIGKKNEQPASPDYRGAAEATAAANRVNYNTPYGGLQYSQGPNGQWTANVSLSPDQQRLQDQNTQTSLRLGQLQGGATDRVAQTMGQSFDGSTLPQAPVNSGTTGQQAIMNRLEPQFNRDEERLRTRLANQGIMQGSDAYNAEINNFDQRRNDAYSQAALQGINLDTAGRQNALQEQSYFRSLPLNELNALRTGTQVQGPQFQGIPQTQGPNYLAAAQLQGNDSLAGFNAGQASQNNLMGGLFQIGSKLPWQSWFGGGG